MSELRSLGLGNVASAMPLGIESEATACGGALSKDALNGVFRPGTSSTPAGRGQASSSGSAGWYNYAINHVTYTAANGEVKGDVQGA